MAGLTEVLDAINAALGIIKTVTETPGVNALPYVNTVSAAVTALQAAYGAGKAIEPYIEAIADTFSGNLPDQAALTALDARIAELEAELDAPLPDAEAGEPA